MAKYSKTLLLATLVASLAACGGKKDVAPQQVADCTFPDATDVAAPGWICDEPVEGYSLTAVGSAEKSGAGNDFMKQQAATSARVQLAQVFKVHVQNMVKQFAETTGAADAETVDKTNTVVTKQITDETLVGSRVLKTRVSPNGTLYALVGLDTAAVNAATKEVLATSMKNERAQWQQWRAEKGQEELAEAIANQQQ